MKAKLDPYAILLGIAMVFLFTWYIQTPFGGTGLGLVVGFLGQILLIVIGVAVMVLFDAKRRNNARKEG